MPVHDFAFQTTEIYELACSVEFQGTSVLAAVEAKPASPVLAALAASTAAPRTAGGRLWLASQRDQITWSFTMPFQVEELSLQLIDALAPLMPRIKQRDKDLADQLRRAASSIGLNCAEASFSDPGNPKSTALYGGR